MDIPIVAIIGRPNVGKSTLFNRIIRKPLAITDITPGVTRDRNYSEFEWNGRNFMLVDTGGYVISSKDTMERAVSEQSRLAIVEADVILFLIDVKSGITDLDTSIRDELIKSGKPVILGVNKVDRTFDEYDVYEFYKLGFGDPYPLSAIKGRGTGDLLDVIVESLPPERTKQTEYDEALKIALIGRPNVGKSSIVNMLTGKNSVLVTDIPGTTRDSTDTHITVNGRRIIIVDTAGMKRITRLKESLEYYSSLRALRSLSRCDVAVVVIDISEAPSIGGITYSDGRFYLGSRYGIYSFSEGDQELTTVTILPENNITGLVVIGRVAFATVNAGNGIYQVDLGTGEYSKFITDLTSPYDLELLPN